MDRRRAIKQFKELMGVTGIPRKELDLCMLNEAWGHYVDMLYSNQSITENQVFNWLDPYQ